MKEFCLLDEPWIRVLWADLSIKEISLKDSLLSSYEYMRLIGEVFPAQAGVILSFTASQLLSHSFPRASGGDPWNNGSNAGVF